MGNSLTFQFKGKAFLEILKLLSKRNLLLIKSINSEKKN